MGFGNIFGAGLECFIYTLLSPDVVVQDFWTMCIDYQLHVELRGAQFETVVFRALSNVQYPCFLTSVRS